MGPYSCMPSRARTEITVCELRHVRVEHDQRNDGGKLESRGEDVPAYDDGARLAPGSAKSR
jgi:hypothetical protein